MAASRVLDTFMLNIMAGIDADVTLVSVDVRLQGGFTNIYYWVVRFTYITGVPAATAFRLNSADGLTGTFSPTEPQGIGAEVKNAVLFGTVTVVVPDGEDVTYTGTVTIIQE